MKIHIGNESTKLLFLLILADLGFMLVHVLHQMHFINNPLFSIEKDLGYAEVYQYLKEFWIFILLFVVAIRSRYLIYFSWSLLFVYLLLDDSLGIHENFGRYLAEYFNFQPMFQLRSKDFGELIVSIFFGTLLFTFIGISYLFSGPVARQISKHLFILVMSVAFFGVLVDMLHTAIPWGKSVVGLIEDGGEMLIMSIIVCYAFQLKEQPFGAVAISPKN